MNSTKSVWLVTGASKGLGLSLVKRLLAEGHSVVATSRRLDALTRAVGPQSASFLPVEVDLSDEASVRRGVERAIATFGRVDVLVNNAGYGQFGVVEEVTDQEARLNFEVNVFGLLNITRAVLPFMREAKSGHVFNISSIGGYTGAFAGVGIYCATKFAVAGLSEGLKADVEPFGIHVTVVYPGYFRTDFLSGDSMGLPSRPMAEYVAARALVDQHASVINQNQPGDPDKAAAALISAAASEKPPLHLFLGPDAYTRAVDKIASVEADLAAWKTVSVSTNL